MKTPGIKHGELSHGDILKIAAALLALGRTDFADIGLYRKAPLFKEPFGLRKVPSAETLRQRLNELGLLNSHQTLLDNCLVEILRKARDFGAIQAQCGNYWDIDVSVRLGPDYNKEGVGWTYHNENGYAPIACRVGIYGYMLAYELREEIQHSANEAVGFVRRCLKLACQTGLEAGALRVRVDSGHDDKDFIGELCGSEAKFLAKHNLCCECPEQYLALARRVGEKLESRDGKNIYHCILSHKKTEGLKDKPVFMVVEAVECLTDAKTGEDLLLPELEVATWRTNLTEIGAMRIELYHTHATSEQCRGELKSDMGLERLPSGKFATNALILNAAALAYNCLRFIGQEAIACKELLPVKIDEARWRIRSVLQDLIYVGCKFTRHAKQIILKFGRHCPWGNVIQMVYARC